MPWASKEKRAEYQRRYRAAKKAIDPDFENRRARAYRAADPKAHTEASMKWARNNPEKVREIARRTYQRRKETVKARTKAYANSPQGKARAKERAKSPEFKAKKNAYLRERRASDPAYKALYYFRIRFRQWIKGNKGVSVRDLVG